MCRGRGLTAGRLVLWGALPPPPTPPAGPCRTAGVLTVAEGCCRGAGPGLRAVGSYRKCPSGRKPERGAQISIAIG